MNPFRVVHRFQNAVALETQGAGIDGMLFQVLYARGPALLKQGMEAAPFSAAKADALNFLERCHVCIRG
jgi:hypothetical protein